MAHSPLARASASPTDVRETVLAARVLALIFLGAAPAHLVVLPGTARFVMVAAALATAVVSLGVGIRARRVAVDRLWVPVLALSIAALAHAVLLVATTREIEQTTVFMLTVVGVAAMNPAGRQVVLLVGASVTAWVLVVLVLRPGPWDHVPTTALHVAISCALAAAVFQVRSTGLRRLGSARRRLAEQVAELEALRVAAELGHRRFRSVFDDSPVGIALADEHGRLVEANEALCGLLGRPWEQIEGCHLGEFTHPDDATAVAHPAQVVQESRDGVRRVEQRYVRPDGDVVWAWLTVRDVAGPAGEVWTLAHVQDVTERKETDEELIRSREGLRASVEIARAAQHGADPRPLVLQSIASLAHVSTVSLLEPIGEDHLAVTATSGVENLVGVTIDLDEPSATAHVWHTGEPLFASVADENPLVGRELMEQSGASSLLWQPVGLDGHVSAILALGWDDRLGGVSESERTAVEAIAAETAMALHSERMRQQLELTVVTDSLTGLLNRRGWDEQTLALVRQSQRTDEPFTIALADLDHFKAYNDTHGHMEADQALVAFAAEARRSLRVVDVIARWGGEEFAIALRDTTREQAAVTLERLRRTMPEGLTCSIGYAEVRPGETVSEVLRRADAALYRAKRNGRDRLEEADDGSDGLADHTGMAAVTGDELG